jgi:hypothetical protein
MIIDPRLHRIVASQPHPLVFATISGAHLYGFPSPDSDFDLRGSHLLPLERVVGLDVSFLPELPSDATRAALDDLLIRTRLAGRA